MNSLFGCENMFSAFLLLLFQHMQMLQCIQEAQAEKSLQGILSQILQSPIQFSAAFA